MIDIQARAAPLRRGSPQRVKLHRIYSASELARCCGVHKNTVRHWLANGLEAIGAGRPMLFDGATVRAFLAKRNATRKRPCPPGTIYCFKCRQPQRPALDMVEFTPHNPATGNLSALCEQCGTVMHRRARLASLAAIMPDLAVQIREAPPRLSERPPASLNCDNQRD
ncbi:MAG: helix-turn-helix domain-containing protein [Novosphingobium sp.]